MKWGRWERAAASRISLRRWATTFACVSVGRVASRSSVPPGPRVAGGRGRRERTWRLLHEAGFASGVPSVTPHWRHTFHALPRLVLDYVLVRDRLGRVAKAVVERLDEDARDRGPTVFGSDHHPLLARIELRS